MMQASDKEMKKFSLNAEVAEEDYESEKIEHESNNESDVDAAADEKTGRKIGGAAVAGGVTGALIAAPMVAVDVTAAIAAGPVVAVAAAGAAAYVAATNPGKAGEVIRAGGEAVASAGDNMKKTGQEVMKNLDKKFQNLRSPKKGKKLVRSSGDNDENANEDDDEVIIEFSRDESSSVNQDCDGDNKEGFVALDDVLQESSRDRCEPHSETQVESFKNEDVLDDKEEPMSGEERRKVGGAAVIGGVTGALLAAPIVAVDLTILAAAAPVVAIAAAGGAAYMAVNGKGKAGDAVRASGEKIATAGDNFKKAGQETLANAGERFKEFDKNMQKKSKETLANAGERFKEFDKNMQKKSKEIVSSLSQRFRPQRKSTAIDPSDLELDANSTHDTQAESERAGDDLTESFEYVSLESCDKPSSGRFSIANHELQHWRDCPENVPDAIAHDRAKRQTKNSLPLGGFKWVSERFSSPAKPEGGISETEASLIL